MSIKPFLAITTALAGVGLLAAACGGSTASRSAAAPAKPASISIEARTATVAGQTETILVEGTGKTLYLFTPEKDGKVSTSGSVLEQWHALLLPSGTSGASEAEELPGMLGTVVRPEGTRQVTYNEWPLYTFAGDRKPGDTNGQGVGNQWFVVQSAMPQDADDDADGTVATPAPATPAPAVPTAAPAPVPVQAPAPRPRPAAPAFNDGDSDNRGGPSDGDGNG